MSDWDLDEELGPGRLEEIVRDLYDALFADILVGFLFQPHDKEKLIESQQRWLRAHLGRRSGKWDGPSIRASHEHLPILEGMFDRRHHILTELLAKWEVPDHVATEWLELDQALRPLVLNLGAQRRDDLLGDN